MSKTPTFEDNLAELESLITQLESGSLPLNDLVARHQRGKKLLSDLDLELKNAEQSLETIQLTSEE